MMLIFLIFLLFCRPITSEPKPNESRIIFPDLIVPVTQNYPNRAYITEYTGNVYFSGDERSGNEVTVLVSFRIPDDKQYNTCNLLFELPKKLPQALDNPEFQWSITGEECVLDVYSLCGCHMIVPEKTPWESKPPRYPTQPVYRFHQSKNGGRAGVLGAQFPCPLGQVLEFEITSGVRDKPMMLHWYELENPRSGIMIEMSKLDARCDHCDCGKEENIPGNLCYRHYYGSTNVGECDDA